MARATTTPAPARGTNWWAVALLSVIVLAGAAVRIVAATDAMWMDEIWSLLLLANKARSPWQIIAGMHESNNHHLVTLWMYLCGYQPGSSWFIYRVPSLLAGVGTILLSAQMARRWGTWSAVLAAAISASSFVLITYASEARGYALAGFFALAGYCCAEQFLTTRHWRWSVGFAVATWLGFLSQFAIVFYYAGVGVWSLWALAQTRTNWRGWAVDCARLHVPAALGLAGIGYLTLRGYIVGGTPDFSVLTVVARTFLLAVGADSTSGPLLGLGMVVVLALIVAAIWLLWREGDTLWVFFAVTIVIAPALLVLTRPSALAERFFYVPIMFFLVLMTYLLVRVWRWGWLGPSLAAVGLMLMLVGNLYWTEEFLRYGRGHYLEAIRYIVDHTEGPRILLNTDHKFRNGLLLTFYHPFLQDTRPMGYVEPPTAANPPEWRIFHGTMSGQFAPLQIQDSSGVYRLSQTFRHAGLSGFDWAVYHRVESAQLRPDPKAQPQPKSPPAAGSGS